MVLIFQLPLTHRYDTFARTVASYRLNRGLTIAVIQMSVKADTVKSSSHTSDSCPSAEPQQGSNYSKLSDPPFQSGIFLTRKKMPNFHAIILHGMQHSGERVQGGRSSYSVFLFVLKTLHLTL